MRPALVVTLTHLHGSGNRSWRGSSPGPCPPDSRRGAVATSRSACRGQVGKRAAAAQQTKLSIDGESKLPDVIITSYPKAGEVGPRVGWSRESVTFDEVQGNCGADDSAKYSSARAIALGAEARIGLCNPVYNYGRREAYNVVPMSSRRGA